MAIQDLALAVMRLDGGTQPRTAISDETVANYAEHMQALAPKFPPVVVFFDGVDYWLADGFHRYRAASRIGRESLEAEVHSGTRRDAVLFSACANRTHGLPRTNADKRKAVMTLLNDDEWGRWPQPDIAKACGVSREFVNRVHGEMKSSGSLTSDRSQVTVVTKHGTEATMHTENIGKSRLKMPDRSKASVAERRERMRELAAEGYTSRQIAATLDITESGCRSIMRKEAIDVPADRIVGKAKRHDANRIVDQMVIQAEGLTADVALIDFEALDPQRLIVWLASLKKSRNALGEFIRRLMKEQQKHVEAA